MRRREFITLLVAASWPRSASAQRTGKLWRIGVLSGLAPPATVETTPLGGFLLGMSELGYQEGRDFVVEWRFADGLYGRFPELADELVQLNVDVVLVSATAGIRAMQEATKTIPIVMGISFDPVGNGLIASLARPGGNTTGLSTLQEDLVSKHVELIKTAVPSLSRVAILTNPENRSEPSTVANAKAAAAKAGLAVVFVQARNLGELESAFVTMAKERVQGLVAVPDLVFTSNLNRIAELALQKQLPAIFTQREFVALGGLMSYGESLRDFFRRSAAYVDKILKGAKPADLPVEQPTRFFLVINLKTAKAIGLTMPPTLLATADEVIE